VIKHLESHPPLNYSDRLYSVSSFREKFGSLAVPTRSDGKTALPQGDHRLSERDMQVLIKWLSRDAGVLAFDGEVVKVVDDLAEGITEADRGTVTILTTIKTVEKQITSLTSQISR
jgi:charged multivesicular body protein 7